MEEIILGKRLLTAAMKPDGVNIGFNLGSAAGGSIAHLHGHIVPRWNGDNNFMPVVGQTRVLPQSLDATWERLAACAGSWRPNSLSRTARARKDPSFPEPEAPEPALRGEGREPRPRRAGARREARDPRGLAQDRGRPGAPGARRGVLRVPERRPQPGHDHPHARLRPARGLLRQGRGRPLAGAPRRAARHRDQPQERRAEDHRPEGVPAVGPQAADRVRDRPGRHGQDLPGDGGRRLGAPQPRGRADRAHPPRGRGRRGPGIPAGRPPREDPALPAARSTTRSTTCSTRRRS